MIRKKAGEVEWLEFELFANEPKLAHGIFLRGGGVSKGPYASLNVGGRGKMKQQMSKKTAAVFLMPLASKSTLPAAKSIAMGLLWSMRKPISSRNAMG